MDKHEGKERSDIPAGVKGWSWGAFFLTWIWGMSNRVWISLLALIPFVNLIVAIVLGIKGREWAWKAQNWTDLEQFNKRQRRWNMVGLITFIFIVIAFILYPQYRKYEYITSKAVHYYSYQKGDVYGYEEKASKADLKKGQLSNKLILAKFLGDNGIDYKIVTFTSIGSDKYSIFTCHKPCAFAKAKNYYDGNLVSEHVWPVKTGTILWEIMQDAMNGKLTVYQQNEQQQQGEQQETTRKPAISMSKYVIGRDPYSLLRNKDFKSLILDVAGGQELNKLETYHVTVQFSYHHGYSVAFSCMPNDCGNHSATFVLKGNKMWIEQSDDGNTTWFGNPSKTVITIADNS